MSIEFNAGLQGFNPRTYIRYDFKPASFKRDITVSIHVPI